MEEIGFELSQLAQSLSPHNSNLTNCHPTSFPSTFLPVASVVKIRIADINQHKGTHELLVSS
jgi:hypothetical protein